VSVPSHSPSSDSLVAGTRFSFFLSCEANSYPFAGAESLKALVTGANGFIGSHLVERLLRSGTKVRCFVCRTSDLRWLKGLQVEIAYGDCVDKESLSSAVAGLDCVYHLAGATKAKRKADFFAINAGGTENLVRACLEHNPRIEKFVCLSSQSASGPCVDERMKVESYPSSPLYNWLQGCNDGRL
jgi:dihydroflavonol-4-reductase